MLSFPNGLTYVKSRFAKPMGNGKGFSHTQEKRFRPIKRYNDENMSKFVPGWKFRAWLLRPIYLFCWKVYKNLSLRDRSLVMAGGGGGGEKRGRLQLFLPELGAASN
jgi:hypothetical protein